MEMMENKKLRLLVTTDCPNKCPLCCNNRFDFDLLPEIERFNYDEVMLTGGEPLLFPEKVLTLARTIKGYNRFLYPDRKTKIYVYTALIFAPTILSIIEDVDGIVVTPHNKEDIDSFIALNDALKLYFRYRGCRVSLRLNLFKDIKALLPKDIDLSFWKVKDMEWVKDCPVPEGEDFKRLPNLWKLE